MPTPLVLTQHRRVVNLPHLCKYLIQDSTQIVLFVFFLPIFLQVVPEFNRIMGNVLVPVVYLVTFVTSLVFRRPNLENPTLIDAQGEQAQRDAERAARRAQEFLEQI